MNNYPILLIADKDKNIYDIPGIPACGMQAGQYLRLEPEDLIPLPSGSELFILPDRIPVGIDLESGLPQNIIENPFAPGQSCYPVSAFVSPGYTQVQTAAYSEKGSAPFPRRSGLRFAQDSLSGKHLANTIKNKKHYSKTLPLFSYSAVARSEEHTSELQSHSFISYAVFCLKKKK